MEKEIGWFAVGVLTGIILAGVVRVVRQQTANENVDRLADSIAKKLDQLETELATS